MEIKFNNLKELYQRLKPALATKKRSFYRQGIKYIKEEDIWNYLKDTKWVPSVNLSLADMVNDILGSDDELIDNYVKNILVSSKRNPNLKDD